MMSEFLSFVLVAALWGFTNPLLNRAANQGEDNSKTKEKEGNSLSNRRGNKAKLKHVSIPPAGWISRVINSIIRLFSIKAFVVAWLVNQLGSVLYLRLLSQSDLSLALPLCNALTFVFTAISARLLGERPLNNGTIFGIVLVLIGVSISMLAKQDTEHVQS